MNFKIIALVICLFSVSLAVTEKQCKGQIKCPEIMGMVNCSSEARVCVEPWKNCVANMTQLCEDAEKDCIMNHTAYPACNASRALCMAKERKTKCGKAFKMCRKKIRPKLQFCKLSSNLCKRKAPLKFKCIINKKRCLSKTNFSRCKREFMGCAVKITTTDKIKQKQGFDACETLFKGCYNKTAMYDCYFEYETCKGGRRRCHEQKRECQDRAGLGECRDNRDNCEGGDECDTGMEKCLKKGGAGECLVVKGDCMKNVNITSCNQGVVDCGTANNFTKCAQDAILLDQLDWKYRPFWIPDAKKCLTQSGIVDGDYKNTGDMCKLVTCVSSVFESCTIQQAWRCLWGSKCGCKKESFDQSKCTSTATVRY